MNFIPWLPFAAFFPYSSAHLDFRWWSRSLPLFFFDGFFLSMAWLLHVVRLKNRLSSNVTTFSHVLMYKSKNNEKEKETRSHYIHLQSSICLCHNGFAHTKYDSIWKKNHLLIDETIFFIATKRAFTRTITNLLYANCLIFS